MKRDQAVVSQVIMNPSSLSNLHHMTTTNLQKQKKMIGFPGGVKKKVPELKLIGCPGGVKKKVPELKL
jgi:hypothetical protein